MESLKELYRIGHGPSSSHTLGPSYFAKCVKDKYPSNSYEVTLYGSLSLTGKGHLTDETFSSILGKENTKIIFSKKTLDYHPNGMEVKVLDNNKVIDDIVAYSVGGGKIVYDVNKDEKIKDVYKEKNMEEILAYCSKNNLSFYEYAIQHEDDDFKEYILEVLDTMYASIKRGLSTTGVIPGKLKLQRVAKAMNDNIFDSNQPSERWLIAVSSYAYAVAEENACGNVIVTAPTCGASGVLPAVLYYCYNDLGVKKNQLVEALCVAGIIGNVVKNNATISGAEGGCQAEIGVACSMAAGAYAYINSLSNKQICYASEMGLEHNLGLTCDPIGGYVQIPCIERNGFAALRAIDCANYAKQLGPLRENKISFDTIVKVMKETGKDLGSAYKETSLGGLAREYKLDED